MSEALPLAGRLGISTFSLAEAIEGEPLDARIADAKLRKMERGDFESEFPLEWAPAPGRRPSAYPERG